MEQNEEQKPTPIRLQHENGHAIRIDPATDAGPQPLIDFADPLNFNAQDVVESVQGVLQALRQAFAAFDADESHLDLKPEALARLQEAHRQEVTAKYEPFFRELLAAAENQAEHRQALVLRATMPHRYSGNRMLEQRAATEIAMGFSQPLQGKLPTVELDAALRAKNIDLATALVQRAATVKDADIVPSERARYAAVEQRYRAMLDVDSLQDKLADAEQTLSAVKAASRAVMQGNSPQAMIALGLAALPKDSQGYLSTMKNPFR